MLKILAGVLDFDGGKRQLGHNVTTGYYAQHLLELLNPKRSLNHICQNVPVTTAEHPAEMVKKYLEGRLDLIDTDFMVQDNKKKTYEYEKSPLQLDQFML